MVNLAIPCGASDLRLRQNNFDLLRFVFACVVCLVHVHALSDLVTFSIFSDILSSEIAVKSFFIVSGFLIFMSYEHSRNLRHYAGKRFRRIYPAYFFIIIACVVLGSVLTTQSWQHYFSLPTLKYVAANLLFLNFLQPNLTGVFEHNPLQAMNGALWTLKIEVLFYLCVPLVVLACRKLGRFSVLIALYVASVLYSMSMSALAIKTGAGFYLELQRQLPGQIAFFVAGAAGYYYLDSLTRYAKYLVPAAILAFIAQSWLPWVAVQPIALAILVVYAACIFPWLGNFDKYGDFSYGIYIVHFPILQLFIAQGWFNQQPWIMLIVACGTIVFAAFLLWHLIEKPFLRKSSHYVVVNRG